MMIPGFLSLFSRWEKVVEKLNENYKIHYIESRDKITSKFFRRASMKICEMSKDLVIIEKTLELNNRKYITISSSMGGSMVLECLATKSISPIGSIFIGPVIEINTPRWIPALLRVLPPFAVNWLKPLMRWGIRNKMVDSEKEPEQLREYINSINKADPAKLKKWFLINSNKYDCWHILSKIKNRIIIIGTSTDMTHKNDMAEKASNKLLNSTYVELRSNKAAHDLAFVEVTMKFMKELAKKDA